MTSETSKRRDFLSLIFISKSISKKLLIKLFHSSGKILVSIDRLKMSARESEIRSKHSLRSLAETVSSPVAFLMHNLR